mmetsp:Transcript_26545/g.60508  ORF Transcript_26545/g.60508 Transcript_26545/m.60508 type:complete len:241 (-) Transcript_26545:16-738(-)
MGDPSRNEPVLRPAPFSVGLVQENADVREPRQELEDLGTGQVLLPPNLLAQSGDKVVVVHEGVDDGVNNHTPQGSLQPAKLAPAPADPQHAHVVVHMQRDRGLLLQDQQDRVAKLIKLRQVVDFDPEPGCAIQHVVRIPLTAEDPVKSLLGIAIRQGEDPTHRHQHGQGDEHEVVNHGDGQDLHRLALPLLQRPDTGKIAHGPGRGLHPGWGIAGRHKVRRILQHIHGCLKAGGLVCKVP